MGKKIMRSVKHPVRSIKRMARGDSMTRKHIPTKEEKANTRWAKANPGEAAQQAEPAPTSLKGAVALRRSRRLTIMGGA
jgi:hypothetical protein